MRNFTLPASLLLSLSACVNGAGSPPSGDDTGAAQPSVQSIAGVYRVAGVNSDEVSLPFAMTAEISATAIAVRSDCIGMAWDYTVTHRGEDTVLSTTSVPTRSCRRALLPPEQGLQDVLNAGGTLSRAPSGALVITAATGNVILYSQ